MTTRSKTLAISTLISISAFIAITFAIRAIHPPMTLAFSESSFPLVGNKSVVENKHEFVDRTIEQGHPYTAFDIVAQPDTPVQTMIDGEIVDIDHSDAYADNITIYSDIHHISIYYTHIILDEKLAAGDAVERGSTIGKLASTDEYPEIGVSHLHIDASKSKKRMPCSRKVCEEKYKNLFVDIGPDLYRSWARL